MLRGSENQLKVDRNGTLVMEEYSDLKDKTRLMAVFEMQTLNEIRRLEIMRA